MSASKSKYVPASIYNVIRTLEKENNPNYIIVGTPCQIMGIKKYIDENNIKDKDLIFLGLFCDRTLNFNVFQYFEDKYSQENEKIVKFDFRNKENGGWPGNVKIYFNSGRELIINRKERIKIMEYFQLERCLYCLDKLNPYADISFGDCYIIGKENPGRSSIIVRTKKGKYLWNRYRNLFKWEESSIESIKRSQLTSKKRDELRFLKIFREKEDFFEDYSGEAILSDKEVANKLSKRRKYIEWGRNYKVSKIKRSIFFSRFKFAKEVIKGGVIIGKQFLGDLFKKQNKEKETAKGENVIILGASSSNKGSQAMIFTVVDQVKRRFPKKNVYLFSNMLSHEDFGRDEKEKELYDFQIMPWRIGTKLNLLSFGPAIEIEQITYPSYLKKTRKIIKNSSFFIDISGYALSSQFRPKDYPLASLSYNYMLNIMVAKKFNVPFYILPQSIGPFDYPLMDKIFLYPLMWKYLKYPKKIFVREKKGVERLKKFTRDNVERHGDIVLLNEGYDLNNIFKGDFSLKNIGIPSNSVGIIPNTKIMERVNHEKIYTIYKTMIEKLIEHGKNVYILRHASEDYAICRKIKDMFPRKEVVDLFTDELNAIELERIIRQFDFVVASRYHSIVHAYKNGVPALVIGWADKYLELLNDFGQSEYLFDVKEDINKNNLIKSLEKLIKEHEKEKNKIKSKMKVMGKNRVFDMIKDDD